MNEVMELTPNDASAQPGQRSLAAVATPAQLLQIAVERGADLAYIEKLMELKERHDANEARKAYALAFAAFKAEPVNVVRNRDFAGPLAGKKYADLFAITDAATPALSKHGFAASWRNTKDEKDWIEITCTLQHQAGHFETVSMGGPPDAGGAKNLLQARFSTTTYLERRTLKAILGLADQDEDDDGAGGAKADPLEVWSGRAALAQTLDKLGHVSKDGAKHFRGAGNVDAYKLFAQSVMDRGAALRAAGATQ